MPSPQTGFAGKDEHERVRRFRPVYQNGDRLTNLAACRQVIVSRQPGSVSPFGLIHDRTHQVRVVIDRDLKSADRVSFHPNINTVTLTIAGSEFERFLAACGNPVRYVAV